MRATAYLLKRMQPPERGTCEKKGEKAVGEVSERFSTELTG